MRAMLISSTFLFWACASAPPIVNVGPTDLSILAAVVADPYLIDAPRMTNAPLLVGTTDLLAVSTATLAPTTEFEQVGAAEIVHASQALIESLLSRNREKRSSLTDLPLPQGWELVESASDVQPRDGTRRIVTVSLPGIVGDKAIVAVARDYNSSCCPQGYALLLQMIAGRWVVVAHGGEWIT